MTRRAAALTVASCVACSSQAPAATCPPRGAVIVVETGQHRLWTCHGPSRGWEKLPAAINTATDWTLGGIAVGSDDEIDRISAWVNGRGVKRIVIR